MYILLIPCYYYIDTMQIPCKYHANFMPVLCVSFVSPIVAVVGSASSNSSAVRAGIQRRAAAVKSITDGLTDKFFDLFSELCVVCC